MKQQYLKYLGIAIFIFEKMQGIKIDKSKRYNIKYNYQKEKTKEEEKYAKC